KAQRLSAARSLCALRANLGDLCGKMTADNAESRLRQDPFRVFRGPNNAASLPRRLGAAQLGRVDDHHAHRDPPSHPALRLPAAFTLTTEVEIDPENNKALEGLYMSGGRFCTQCESEGFRKITWWPDRPDVLSRFTVRIEADKAFRHLLSNGNLVDSGQLPGG